MSKKILSVVLALVFVVSAFAVSAFAVGDTAVDPEASTKTQTWALSEPAGEGPYTVDVSLTANYKVGAIQFKVANADGNAVLTDVALNAAVFGEDWEDNYDIDKTDDGLVIIIPTPKNASKAGPDLTAGAKIATLTYELAEGKTSAKIAIENDPKTAGNIGGSLIAVRMSDDSLTTGTLYYGQTVLSVGEAKTIGSAAAEPELVAKAGKTGYVDNEKGLVYGVDAGADTALYFEATNEGYFEMTASALDATNGATNGTGAVLTLYNKSGVVVKTYTLIIFGDVNGDGEIATNDGSAIYSNIGGFTIFTEIQKFAADTNADGELATNDGGLVYSNIGGFAEISQTR